MSMRTRSECQHVAVNSSAANFTLVNGVAGQIVSVYAMILTIGATAVQVNLEGTVTPDISQLFNLPANGSIVLDRQISGDPWWIFPVGEGVSIEQSGTTQIGVDLYYLQTV